MPLDKKGYLRCLFSFPFLERTDNYFKIWSLHYFQSVLKWLMAYIVLGWRLSTKKNRGDLKKEKVTVKSVQSTQRGDSGIYPWTQVVLLRPQCSVMSNSATHGLWPTRLLCPWDLQARILEWVAISFSRGSSPPWHRTQVSCIASRCFTLWATREAQEGERRDEFQPSELNVLQNAGNKHHSEFFLTTDRVKRKPVWWHDCHFKTAESTKFNQ